MAAASSSREIGVFYKPELSEGLNPKNDDTKCVFKIIISKLKPTASELSRKKKRMLGNKARIKTKTRLKLPES